MGNPPITYFINMMNAVTLIGGGDSTIMIPTNMATILPGFFMSNIFNKGLSKKYLAGDTYKLKYIDIATHWIPTILLLLSNRTRRINEFVVAERRVKKRHYAIATLLPWIYFTVGNRSNGSFGLRNPIRHLVETYPGVPFWVFPMWYVGIACTNASASAFSRV